MFPEYKSYIPRQIGRASTIGIDFFKSMNVDEPFKQVFSAELNRSVETLMNSYRYFNQELIGILSILLEGQAISVTTFPHLNHPRTGIIIKPSPVAGYKKLTNIKISHSSLNATSFLLSNDLDTENNEALFAKIDRLQHSKHPIFYDFFDFLNFDWWLFCDTYAKHHHQAVPDRDLLRDEFGYFDSSKFEELFQNDQALMECVIKLIVEPAREGCISLYGFGLQLILKGRVDVLAYLLNNKLHPFDAIFLKFILPDRFKACLKLPNSPEKIDYFTQILFQLETLSDSNFKQHLKPEILAPLYQDLMDTYHVFFDTSSIGSRCNVHLFSKAAKPSAENKTSIQQTTSLASDPTGFAVFQENWGPFQNHLLNPLMLYLMKLIIQIPHGKLIKQKGRIGPILRAMFPGRGLDVLTLPLSEIEERTATQLLTATEENAPTSTLQVYHLTPLSTFQTFIVNGMHLLMEGFLQVNNKMASKGRTIYQGSHDVYQLSPLGTNIKTGVTEQTAEINAIYKLWKRLFGFKPHYHPIYLSMNNVPYRHANLSNDQYALHLTPNTSVVKQEKSRLRFYPLAFAGKGLYCHLSEGTNIPVKIADNTQHIASGCCLLGNDFVATVKTAEGNKPYHVLDAHQEVPNGAIVDVSFQHPEHPEEAMYLAIQKTLAPFYRAAYKNKKIIFYYHDLRMDYLTYLLPHYIKGTLSLELLLKAIAIINERHHLMVSKLSAILAPYTIECCALSALNSLNTADLLQQVDTLRQNTPGCDIESALTTYILQFMATDAVVPTHSKQVYAYVLAQQTALQELLQQKGVRFIAVVNYMAQFALINLRAQSPLLVALSSVEYKLLKSYELTFATIFGSVIHFLWMNPITIRDDIKHNRLFFVDKDIAQICALINTAAEPLQRMIGYQALDNPQGVMREWNGLKSKLSQFPCFFAQPNKDDNNAVDHTVVENPGVV